MLIFYILIRKYNLYWYNFSYKFANNLKIIYKYLDILKLNYKSKNFLLGGVMFEDKEKLEKFIIMMKIQRK